MSFLGMRRIESDFKEGMGVEIICYFTFFFVSVGYRVPSFFFYLQNQAFCTKGSNLFVKKKNQKWFDKPKATL